MKISNYADIADRYDNNPYRKKEVQFDMTLKEHIESNINAKYNVLDLACGTGIYLEKQKNFFTDAKIYWHGLDASEDMLRIARQKLDGVSLTHGLAEDMPYTMDTFDFISNNYAFQHFTDKSQSLNEIHRVLKRNGIFKLHNITIHDMPKWWVYHYFPTAYYEDLKRFWAKEVIFNELILRGFDVTVKIDYQLKEIKVSDYLGYAENRDISVLTLISDEDYQEGLERIRYDVNTNSEKTIVTDFAEMFCIAKKR